MPPAASELSEFHPTTLIRDWGAGQGFRLADAQTGVCVFGATGSGKTSGPAKHLALGYLAHDFGGLVLCSKKEERAMWEAWAAETGRSDDLIVVDARSRWRFNFLNWEATRAGEGGGLTINIVALLDEIAGAIISGANGKTEGEQGDGKFFRDALHHMNTNLVDLPRLAGYEVTLPLMREIVNTAPMTPMEAKSDAWRRSSACAAIIAAADAATTNSDADARADFEECRTYWEVKFPNLNDRTRSIIVLYFSMLVRPFVTRPLRRLFADDTTITPEAAFQGKVILIDLPVQEFRLAGRVANLAWKYCFQVAVMRRSAPARGHLRPVFLWADEAQNFVTEFDAEYQAVARSAGGCTVYLTQNRESFRRVLGNDDTVDSLLGNLQCKVLCQNSSVDTNEWAAELLGQRWVDVLSTNVGSSNSDETGSRPNFSGGVNRSEERRYFVEPSRFTTLKRGGQANGFQVQAIVYNGGHLYRTGNTLLPYTLLTFNQG
jgi:hypothetical protein